MEMQNLELLRTAPYLFQHDEHVRQRVAHGRVEPQGLRRAGHELRARAGVRRSKQGHLMTLLDELLREVRNDSFGSAVEFRWYRLCERGNLRDFHTQLSTMRSTSTERRSMAQQRSYPTGRAQDPRA